MNKTAIALLLASFLPTVSLAAETLCERNEVVRFSCRIKNSAKTVSVCSSKILNEDSGYLQYRFGTPKKIELTFPSERKNTLGEFTWESHRPYQGYYDSLGFVNGEYMYTIYMAVGLDTEPSYGVTISKNGTAEITREFFCAQPPTGDFTSLGELIPQEEN
jgi:hypothetical protein